MKSKKIYTCFDALAAIASQVVVNYIASRIIIRICQEGGKIMTNAQVAYLEHLERKRSNLIGEAETHRSNVARETETKRHNEVSEAIDTGKLNVDRVEAGAKVGDVVGKHAIPLIGNVVRAARNALQNKKRKASIQTLAKVLDTVKTGASKAKTGSRSGVLPMNTAIAKQVTTQNMGTVISKGDK